MSTPTVYPQHTQHHFTSQSAGLFQYNIPPLYEATLLPGISSTQAATIATFAPSGKPTQAPLDRDWLPPPQCVQAPEEIASSAKKPLLYVNAKQFHRILKRRIMREKLKKQPRLGSKGMKPYLHESRHNLAKQRPRAPNGRFLSAEVAAQKKVVTENGTTDDEMPLKKAQANHGQFLMNSPKPPSRMMPPPNNSDIPQLPVTKLRVVAHALGPVVPGGQLSQNHWSFYLLNHDGGSVRLNMEWVPGTVDSKGTFTVSRYDYALTHSAVRNFDFDVKTNVKVRAFLETLSVKNRQNYKMTPTGVGCRFWV
ncbi:hypothetical protein DV736_g5590, partial [Chaetothyriales sp. CBS 134916]